MRTIIRRSWIAGLVLALLPAATRNAIPVGDGTRVTRPGAPTKDAETVAAEKCRAPLCLQGGKFNVWASLGDVPTTGEQLPGTDEAGVMFAYSPTNPELLIKVLNGCWYNDHWWVYIGTATDQPFTVAVKHVPTDRSKRFDGNRALLGEADIQAFPCEPGDWQSRDVTSEGPAYGSATTEFSSTPTPSISIRTTSPGARNFGGS